MTGPRSEGPEEVKSRGEERFGGQRQRLRADAGGSFGPIAFCPVCPLIQSDPMLSVLITELNVEQRAEGALTGLMLLTVLKLLITLVY